MIRTQDLIEFVKSNINYNYPAQMDIEYLSEIVARLRAYDKLKESIEKLCRDLSSGVDK